ncbi:MAG: hypothetical protein HZR80_20910 [Candidatus Heimdallarchaeota archaeon]
MKKITAFKKVIDEAINEEWEEISEYVDLILRIGIQRMINDAFEGNEPLQETMVSLFEEDPVLISNYIIKIIRDIKLKFEEKEIITPEEKRKLTLEEKWRKETKMSTI